MVRRTVCLVAAIVGFLLFELGMADEAGIPLPEGAVARLGLGWIADVRFSPDGKYLAVATGLGSASPDTVATLRERWYTDGTELGHFQEFK